VDDLSVRLRAMLEAMAYFSSGYLIHDILTQLLDRFRTCWLVLDLHLVLISLYLVIISSSKVNLTHLNPANLCGDDNRRLKISVVARLPYVIRSLVAELTWYRYLHH